MTDTSQAAFIGLDIETTGLDPHHGIILEVGIIILDECLNPLDALSWVSGESTAGIPMDQVVVDMHERSGLTAHRAHGETESIERIEQAAIDFIAEHTTHRLPMLGTNPHFDRAWVEVHMPDLADRFAHRSIDASSTRMAALATCKTDQHRDNMAMLIQDSAEALQQDLAKRCGAAGDRRRPHRPIFDLCGSIAMIRASMDAARDYPSSPHWKKTTGYLIEIHDLVGWKPIDNRVFTNRGPAERTLAHLLYEMPKLARENYRIAECSIIDGPRD